jgi:hypothetical protein
MHISTRFQASVVVYCNWFPFTWGEFSLEPASLCLAEPLHKFPDRSTNTYKSYKSPFLLRASIPIQSIWIRVQSCRSRVMNLLTEPLKKCGGGESFQHKAIFLFKKTQCPESVSELYRPSDRRLSAKLVPTFADRGWHVVSVTNLYGRNLGFLDRSSYFFFQAAPQLCSQSWVDPVPNPLLLRKSSSAGNRTGTSGSVARNSDH